MMTLGKKLKQLMEQRGITHRDLGNALGISESAVSLYANDKRRPKEDIGRRMASYFNIPYSYLIDDDSNYNVKVAVLGDVAGGVPIDAIEDVEEYEEISMALAKTGEFFGLKIRGTSMEDVIHNGDIVICKKQCDVASGEVAVVYMDDYKATCKILYHLADGGIRLEAFNEKVYAPKTFTAHELAEQNFQVLGRVIKSVHNF